LRGPEKTVNDMITNKKIYSIEINKTIQHAENLMNEYNTSFLIVTREHNPKYVLKKAKLWIFDPNDKIEKIANEEKIDKIVTVNNGSSWKSAIPKLAKSSLLVVVDTKISPPQLIGVIDVGDDDFTSKAQPFRQYQARY
jgi:CBS domain-containing protein